MSCTIQQLTCSERNPSEKKELNLSSTSNFKIYSISSLQPFARLRTLILSNNMISKIEGLNNLKMLRVLNLDFNQIKVVQGTENLSSLQQFFISYNQVEKLTDSLLSNRKLRALHLAYNDLSDLDALAVLYQHTESGGRGQPNAQINENQNMKSQNTFVLSHLQALSLQGNPIVNNINYMSFFKMLIPSLRTIDDKNIEDAFIHGSVCPQQEIVILRQAINKLLDERNDAVQRLQTLMEKPQKNKSYDKIINKSKKVKLTEQPYGKQNENLTVQGFQIFEGLQQLKTKYYSELKAQKQKVDQISNMYSQYLNYGRESKQKNKKDDQNFDFEDNQYCLKGQQEEQLFEDVETPYRKQRGDKFEGKTIMKDLKIQQYKMHQIQSKIRNIAWLINYINERKEIDGTDAYIAILQLAIFGEDTKRSLDINECFKLCKKYFIKQTLNTRMNERNEQVRKSNLIQYSEVLKNIIYGDKTPERDNSVSYEKIMELKQKIRNKGLLEIINDLKQSYSLEQQRIGRYEKDRLEFIEKFERQTEQLSKSWQVFNKEKHMFQYEQRRMQQQFNEEIKKKQLQIRRKFKIAEEEEKLKIIDLKRAREALESENQRLNMSLSETQEKLNRRFMQLEQFENHFNQFIEEKQHIKSLQAEINHITSTLEGEQYKFEQLTNKVKQLSLQQGILQNKLNKLNESLKAVSYEISEGERKRTDVMKNLQRMRIQGQRENENLREILMQLNIKTEQVKDFEKIFERSKKNMNLLQEKIKNLEQMQHNKKVITKELQEQIKNLKEDRQGLLMQIDSLEKTAGSRRDQLMKLQLKIQENRLAMENLTDINKSISDMMIRQSELKRSIIELELENKNLMEMKNNLMDDFRIKSYL